MQGSGVFSAGRAPTTGTSAAPAMIGETTLMSTRASARYCRTTPMPPMAPPARGATSADSDGRAGATTMRRAMSDRRPRPGRPERRSRRWSGVTVRRRGSRRCPRSSSRAGRGPRPASRPQALASAQGARLTRRGVLLVRALAPPPEGPARYPGHLRPAPRRARRRRLRPPSCRRPSRCAARARFPCC